MNNRKFNKTLHRKFEITPLWLVIMAFLGAECFFFLNNKFIFCHVEDNCSSSLLANLLIDVFSQQFYPMQLINLLIPYSDKHLISLMRIKEMIANSRSSLLLNDFL